MRDRIKGFRRVAAFLCEIDPLYCDVIVTRWEKFTGRKAERPKAKRTKRVA